MHIGEGLFQFHHSHLDHTHNARQDTSQHLSFQICSGQRGLAKTTLFVFLSCIIQERNSVGYTVILPVLYREQIVWAHSLLWMY